MKNVTIIYDCPLSKCDKLWLKNGLEGKGYDVKTVTPFFQLSHIEQRGKLGRLCFYALTFWQCVKALFVAKKGETVICWSQWSGLFFNQISKDKKRKILSFNWLTPNANTGKKKLYQEALENPNFTAIINSPENKELTLKAYGAKDQNNIICIPDVFDDREPFYAPAYVEEKKDRYFFCGGRANRDWDLFLDLAKEMPDEKFVGVAAGSDWDKRRVIPENVTMYFDTTESEYYALLKGCFATIFPLKENRVSGLINILKSIQYGKIVLTTDLEATRMYYPEECREYLIPMDGERKEAWKKEINKLETVYDAKYEEVVELLQKHVQKKFVSDAVIERIQNYIR